MRYIGSKRRFAPYLLPFIQKALQVYPKGLYIEPFIGGSMFIAGKTQLRCKIIMATRHSVGKPILIFITITNKRKN